MQNQEKPLISVIVPVYNVAPYLPICLNSIINQTYNNLEIILVASTSKDNSVEICDEYAGKDSRISVIHCPPNGLSDGRNRGIEAAHGEYLSFIDSDDFVAPNYLENLLSAIKTSNADFACCKYKTIKEEVSYFKTKFKSLYQSVQIKFVFINIFFQCCFQFF